MTCADCALTVMLAGGYRTFKVWHAEGAYDEAYMDLIDSNHIQDIAKYYMEVHGLSQISYHYGVIDNMKTLYFMF